MSGILTQAPQRPTPHRAASPNSSSTNNPYSPPPRRGPGGTGPGTPKVIGVGADHQPVVVPHRWHTPNLVRLGGALVATAALLTAVVTAAFAADAHDQVATVAHTDAPSVRATGDFLLRVEDMDAQLANALLISGDGSLRTSYAGSVRQLEADRQAADLDLQTATTALAGNSAALGELHTVADMFGTYQEYATRALQLDEQSGTKTAGKAPDDVVRAYRVALEYLGGADGYDPADPNTLAAHAKLLYNASNADIKDSSDGVVGTLNAGEGLLIGSGLLLLAVLGLAQWRASRTFNRTLNPGLLAASVATVVLMIAGTASLNHAWSTFHDGKNNAFDSVQALTNAEAVSFDANADESRWLLDPQNAAAYERAFLAKAKQVADTPADPGAGDTVQGYENRIDGADSSLAGVPESATVLGQADPLSTDSLLGFELINVTFDGELQSALTAAHAYDAYLRADAKIRNFPISTPDGLHRAIDFDTDASTKATSDQAFGEYTRAIEGVVQINQQQFEQSMSGALGTISTWTWLPYPLAGLVVALAFAGLRPRLREYRF